MCLYFPDPRGSELGVTPLTSVGAVEAMEALAIRSTPVEIAVVEMDADAINFRICGDRGQLAGVRVGVTDALHWHHRSECWALCTGGLVWSVSVAIERMGFEKSKERQWLRGPKRMGLERYEKRWNVDWREESAVV